MLLAQRFALAVNGVLAQLNGDDFYVLGGNEPPEEWADLVRTGLRKWWEIEDGASCRETLRWLSEEGHSAELERALTGVRAPDEEPPSPKAIALAREVGGRALIAWDAARLVNVAGWGHVAGYLGEAEAWQQVVNAATVVQWVYGSWQELGEHYLVGRRFWSEDDDDDTADAVRTLLADEASPWRCIPWSTELRIPGVAPRLGPYWSRVAQRFGAQPRPVAGPLALRDDPLAPPAVRVRRIDGADLVRADGKEAWRDAHDLGVARDAIPEEWGPLEAEPSDLAAANARLERFTHDELAFHAAEERQDGAAAERVLLEAGYRSVGHFFRVRATAMKHYATPTGPLLSQSAFDSAACHAAQEKACAALGLPPPPPRSTGGDDLADLGAVLGAELRVGAGALAEAHERAAQALGALFGGGAAQAQAAARADEPVPFEKYCEMTGAMAAWSQSGANVLVEFPRAFGVNLMEYSRIATYWAARMASEPALMGSYMALIQKYTSEYQSR